MGAVDMLFDLVESVKALVFPLSLVLLGLYPIIILSWTLLEGKFAKGAPRAAEHQGHVKRKSKKAVPPLAKRVRGFQLKGSKGGAASPRSGLIIATCFAFFLCAGLFSLARISLGFVLSPQPPAAGCGLSDDAAAVAVAGGAGEDPTPLACGGNLAASEASSSSWGATAAACGAGLIGASVALRLALRSPADSERTRSKKKLSKSMMRVGSGMLRRCASSKQVLCNTSDQKAWDVNGVHWHPTPPDSPESMWHHVSLHVKNWLDQEDKETFHYINEIPHGALQKFELQTKLPMNVIREDAKGSKKLKAFGQPVPFNYGCFPQTFRDPEELDAIHGAPGDNDPLDVLDLCPEAAGVGEVVRCRPLGAVCLIDEGQADYKIIAVNVSAKSPLAKARTIAEAEQISPGRIEQVLRWMDDFKQHSSKTDTTLHYEIHDASVAVGIIQKDFASWERLVKQAGDAGTARGHWIRQPAPLGHQPPSVVSVGLEPPLTALGQVARPRALFTGASVPETSMSANAYKHHALMPRRQISANSDGEDSSGGVSHGRTSSSDEEKGP